MKNSPKRFIALLLALIMVLTTAPLDTVASDDTTYEENVVIDDSNVIQISDVVVASEVKSKDGFSVVVSSIDDILPVGGFVEFTNEVPKAEEQEEAEEEPEAEDSAEKESNAKKSDGKKSDGKKSDGKKSDGKKSDGKKSEAKDQKKQDKSDKTRDNSNKNKDKDSKNSGKSKKHKKEIGRYDITVKYKNGKKWQPKTGETVDVRVRLSSPIDLNSVSNLRLVHDPDDKAETVPATFYKNDRNQLTGFSFVADGFSVYAVIGDTEPTARIQINFHFKDSDGTDSIISTVYVKKTDEENALKTILFDPGIGELGAGESFRGWTFEQNYTATEATTEFNDDFDDPYGAMTIDDIRSWVKAIQPDIVENPMQVYDLYAMIVKHYKVIYQDRFGIALDSDSAYMLRNETVADYTINQNYETNDDDYQFKGWVTNDEDKITVVDSSVTLTQVEVTDEDYDKDPYKLYKNNTNVKISGDVTFRAHAPKGKWLIFHEVMKGATYVAPQFLEEGQSPDMPEAQNMLLLGYTFAGWYKTYTETKDPDTGEVISREYSDPFTPGPISEKTNIYAKWEPANWAPYTVIIWRQNLDGTYAYAESVQLYGTVGTTVLTTGNTSVNAAGNNVLASINNNDADYLVINGRDENNNSVTANYRARHLGRTGTTHSYENPDYIGFNCARIDQDVKIKPEGNAVVNVYYDRITYTIKIYYARSQGTNYQVATTRSGNNDSNPLGPSAANYGMNWTGNILHYKADNGNWVLNGGYTNNIPATQVHTETSGNYTYYYTIINAKYGENIAGEWPRYSLFPDLATGATNNNNNTYGFVSWYMMNDAAGYQGAGSGLNTFKGIISKMDEKLLGDITSSNGNLLFGRYDQRELYYYTYQIWFEALDDVDYAAQNIQTTTGNDGKTYYLKESFVANSAAEDPKKATQAPTYSGFTNVRSVQPAPVNHLSTCEFYYHRVANPIIYRDGAYYDGNNNYLSAYPATGADQESDQIPFEADVTSYNGGYTSEGVLVAGENYKTDYPSSYPGFVFEGWYSDKACTSPYEFTTMPDTSITVYAKFRQVQYRVFLHPNVPTGKYVTWGSDDQGMNFRGTYGTNISLPTGKLITSEATPESYDETYEFAGWYRDDSPFKKPFDPDAYILTDALTSPYDKTSDFTDPMDKYGKLGQNPTNSDITGNNGGDRWWVSKKIDLYAKWTKMMEEGTGIQIIYNPNGGSNEVKDDTLYKDGTNAVAQSAPRTSPKVMVDGEEKEKVFLYWVLQTWNEETQQYEDLSPIEYAYPGDQFNVDFSHARTVQTNDKTEYFIQLRAEYADPDNEIPTHIWWYSNFGDNEVKKLNDTKTAENVEKIKINEGVNIKPSNTFTRVGYTFLGWAQVNSTDGQGNAIPEHPVLHTELGEQDLFLRYVNGHYEAKNNAGTWVTVTQVAADEKFPYQDLYAVWEPYTQVPVEKIWQPGNFVSHEAASVTVELLVNGESFSPKKTTELSAANNWKDTFSNLPTRDGNNQPLRYSIVETVPDGWKGTYDPAYVTVRTDGQPMQPLKVTNTPKNGKITLVKHIAGPTEDFSSVFTSLTFILKGPKQADGTYKNTYTFTFSQFNNNGTTFSGQYTLVDNANALAFVEPGEYIYYESNADLLTAWGYSVDTSNAGTTGETDNPFTFTLSEGGDAQPAITNRYTRDTGTLVINKTVTGDHASGEWPYKVKIKNSEGWWLKQNNTSLTNDESEAGVFVIPRTGETLTGTLTLSNVPTGTYTVIEQGTDTEEEDNNSAQIPNYKLETSYSPDNGKQTVVKGGTAEVTITNTYTRKTAPVTLKKVVSGNQSDVTEEFSFNIRVYEDNDGAPGAELTDLAQTNVIRKHTTPSDGLALGNFPVGAWVKITESDAEAYKTKASTDGTTPSIDDNTPAAQLSKETLFKVTEQAEGASIDVVFSNYANMTIPTGLHLDTAPYLTILALALLGIAAWIVRRRRLYAASRQSRRKG